ncbi:MAG: dihydrofolate reductase family protein [Candidatus Dormibacteria bacterium]
MPKYVVSSILETPEWTNTTVLKGDLVEEVLKLRRQPGRDLLVAGSGQLVCGLTTAGLVDEYRFMVHPVALGAGKRLFPEGAAKVELTLVDVKRHASGVVVLTYVPARTKS